MALGQARGEIPSRPRPRVRRRHDDRRHARGAGRRAVGRAVARPGGHGGQAVGARRGRRWCRPDEQARWRQDDATAMQDRLGRWAADALGPDARVDGLERMPGHWASPGRSTSTSRRRRRRHRGSGGPSVGVAHAAPLGARRSAATDVHRQAPLLTALAEHGVPAPRLRWSGEHGLWFGTPTSSSTAWRALPPGDVFAEGGAPAPAAPVFAEAMRVLARIHATPPPRPGGRRRRSRPSSTTGGSCWTRPPNRRGSRRAAPCTPGCRRRCPMSARPASCTPTSTPTTG